MIKKNEIVFTLHSYININTMSSYKQYTCCAGTRPFHFCRRTYKEKEKEKEEDEEEDEEIPPMPAPIQRQTTQWIVDGQVIFNGNPNGNRLLTNK